MTVKNNIPNLAISVVYKTKNGTWRGFCSPFDITVERETKKLAMKDLEDSVDLYLEGLIKYKFPKSYSYVELSNGEDKNIFNIVRNEVANNIQKKLRDDYLVFQKDTEESFSIPKQQVTASYFYPTAFC